LVRQLARRAHSALGYLTAASGANLALRAGSVGARALINENISLLNAILRLTFGAANWQRLR
jgi:hypothetical protein